MRSVLDVFNFFRYSFIYGIKNLIVWYKVIWNDRNWDYSYIYIILRHKLHLTEKSIRKNNNHVTAKKDADGVRLCVLLLDRLIADDYFEIASRRYKNTKRTLEHEELLREQDLDYLFKFIKKHIKTWWD